MNHTSCICGKSKPFAKCCGRFLSGETHAKTPEQLMRSRYAAYALGGHGAYLISTWFPASAAGLSASELSKKTVDWQSLDVILSSQQGDKGTVEFKAWFKSPNSEKIEVMHEISEFIRINARWLYVGGRVS